jgi:hypothetical protein
MSCFFRQLFLFFLKILTFLSNYGTLIYRKYQKSFKLKKGKRKMERKTMLATPLNVLMTMMGKREYVESADVRSEFPATLITNAEADSLEVAVAKTCGIPGIVVKEAFDIDGLPMKKWVAIHYIGENFEEADNRFWEMYEAAKATS